MNTKTATLLSIKTDKELKSNAQAVAKELGLPLGTIINGYLKNLVRDKRVSFAIDSYQPSQDTLMAIKEARKEHQAGETAGPFKSAQEMLSSLDS